MTRYVVYTKDVNRRTKIVGNTSTYEKAKEIADSQTLPAFIRRITPGRRKKKKRKQK